MANIYWDTDLGDDTTGDGSTGNPYQTLLKCYQVATNLDNLFGRGSTLDTSMYDERVSSGTSFSLGTRNLFISTDPLESNNVEVQFGSDSFSSINTPFMTLSAISYGLFLNNLDIKLKHGGLSVLSASGMNACSIFRHTGSTAFSSITNCNVEWDSTNINSLIFFSSSSTTSTNSIYAKDNVFVGNGNGMSVFAAMNGNVLGNKFENFGHIPGGTTSDRNSVIFINNGSISNNSFYNCFISETNGSLFNTTLSTCIVSNNNILWDNTDEPTGDNFNILSSNNASFTNFRVCFSNIFENTSSKTIHFPEQTPSQDFIDGILGANLLKGITLNTTDYTPSIADITTITSPYLSVDPLNADFMKTDPAGEAVGEGYFPNTSIGNEQFLGSGGGETDPNKVLTTSTIITGNYIPVAKADVKIGVSVGLSETGEYDGSERYTDLSLNKVEDAYEWRYNSLTNNRTGTLEVGETDGTKVLESSTAITGLIPLASVLSADGGTLSEDDVLVSAGGNFTPPANNGEVAIGVNWGVGALDVGTYVAADRYSDPGVSNVKKDTVYKFNSTTNNRTGTLEVTGSSYTPPIPTPAAGGNLRIYDPRQGV